MSQEVLPQQPCVALLATPIDGMWQIPFSKILFSVKQNMRVFFHSPRLRGHGLLNQTCRQIPSHSEMYSKYYKWMRFRCWCLVWKIFFLLINLYSLSVHFRFDFSSREFHILQLISRISVRIHFVGFAFDIECGLIFIALQIEYVSWVRLVLI